MKHHGIRGETVVVILAAGKGTRMGRGDLMKVCFEIDSVPAINRQISVFKKARFERFLLVVGSQSDQVCQIVAKEHPEVLYVYQEPQLGTGHAARLAADALQRMGCRGNVLVSTGDKYIESEAIETLVDGFVKQRADMAMLTIPKTKATEASVGRVFVDEDGQALDIIERLDRARQAVADQLREKLKKTEPITSQDVALALDSHIPDPRKQRQAAEELAALATGKRSVARTKLERILALPKYGIKIDGQQYSARQIERICKGVNPSLYMFQADVFHRAVAMLDNNNAQGEYYLTDVVRRLGASTDTSGKRKYRVRAVAAENPDWIQGFNSPDELLAIQDYVRRTKPRSPAAARTAARPKLKAGRYATASQWLEKIERRGSGLNRWLAGVYGAHEQLHQKKCDDLVKLLNCYGKRFGFDEKLCLVRAPGRINLMGRHVDHRGGMTNFLAIAQETLAAVGLRDDNDVVAVNVEPRKFKPVRFNISELIGRFTWSDWVDFVNSDWVREMTYRTAGDWGNYIKAAMLRLQHRYQDVKVRGINMALSGDVPIAAGLSSSSTIVVATLQAAIALNNFDLTSRQFIDLCGEGEWFVGSRGGSGDHAAISLGKRDKIAHVGYLPFRVERIIDAPGDYQVIVANSHIKAAKSAGAKDQFNSRVAAYNLGLALFKQRSPQTSETVEYLRDVYPEKLGCATSDIYRMLLKVPQVITRKQFRTFLAGEHRELIERDFATHADPGEYHPRGVLLYGIAEIVRSRRCVELLEAGKVEPFGRLMSVSHDGDRVSRTDHDGRRPVEDPYGDECLHRLIDDLASEDPERVGRAQLEMQPGYYACSTPEIDQMVDVAAAVPGVVGAQIAGAGLGGCIMILVKRENADAVSRALLKHYYRPAGLKPLIVPCIGVEGAGLAEW